MGHGADVIVCVVCVVVAPHTLGRLLTIGGGFTGSSSISDNASKAFVKGDVDEGGEGGAWEDEGGGGFFFLLLLSFLYIRVGLV